MPNDNKIGFSSQIYNQCFGFFLGLIVGELFFGEPGLGWVTGLAIGSILGARPKHPIDLKTKN